MSALWADTPPDGRRIVGPAGPTRRKCAGAGPGPGPPAKCRGATRPRWALSAHTLSGMRACSGAARSSLPRLRRGPLRFLRTPRPLLRRGPCPCARPLRRGPPGPGGPRRSPPAPSLGPCAALRASAGARWPRCAWGRPPFAAGALRFASVALASCRPPRCASRGPAGPPPRRPLRGFGAGGLQPRGPARPFGPLVVAFGPRGFCARRACAAALAYPGRAVKSKQAARFAGRT